MPASPLPMDNPLLEDLGVRLVEWQPGLAVFELDLAPRHLNRQGSLQGGVTATLLDAACGYAGLKTPEGVTSEALTLMLNVSYIAAARAGTVRARGELSGGGRGVYFSRGRVTTADGQTVIATAEGVFKRMQPGR